MADPPPGRGHRCATSWPGRWVVPTLLLVASAGHGLGAQECPLPSRAVFERDRMKIPVTGLTESVTVRIDSANAGTWRRRVGDRSLVADVPLRPRLHGGRAEPVTLLITRPLTEAELDTLEARVRRRVARDSSLERDSLERALSRDLRVPCGITPPSVFAPDSSHVWNVLDSALAALRRARDTVRSRRDSADSAAIALAGVLSDTIRWRTPLLRLRAQAAAPVSASAREIRRLDELEEAVPADTAVGRLPRLASRVDRVDDLLATWQARLPDAILPGTLSAARMAVDTLTTRTRSLADRRTQIPGAEADFIDATKRFAASVRARAGGSGRVTIVLRGAIEPEPEDDGTWRLGVGLIYAPLGENTAADRIYPGAFIHWRPKRDGFVKGFSVDAGLSLSTVSKDDRLRDLFWRSSLILGVSHEVIGSLRIGAGLQILREVPAAGGNNLWSQLYVGTSVLQFTL